MIKTIKSLITKGDIMNNSTQLQNIENKLSQLIELVGTPKEWFNTNEISHYLGYSKESIHKMVKSGEFKQGIHYHKKIKRLLFSKKAIDLWVKSDIPANSINYNTDDKINEILSSIVA